MRNSISTADRNGVKNFSHQTPNRPQIAGQIYSAEITGDGLKNVRVSEVSESPKPTIGEFEAKAVDQRAWKVHRKYGLPLHAIDDLKQELFIALLKALPKYDERFNKETFVRFIVKRASFTYLRRQLTWNNDSRRKCELTWEPQCSSTQEETELRLDIDETLEKLPKETREVAQQLRVGNTRNDLDKRTSQFIFKKFKKHLQYVFLANGLAFAIDLRDRTSPTITRPTP